MDMENLILFITISTMILFNSCTDKEEPAQITISDDSVEYFQDRMDFSSEGGSKVIQFSTNKDWEIHVSESGMNVDWCTITPSFGSAGDVSVTINAAPNSSYGERSVILTLSAGEITKKLRVSQKQNDAILISSSLYEVPMKGGEVELTVQSNVDYQLEIPEQYQSWIHRESSSRGLVSSVLRFRIDENVDYEKRKGEIIISDGVITEVVKIYQAGGGILVLSQNEYDVPSTGGTITIDLSSNFEYEYQLPEVDWISLSKGTRGMSSHTLHFDILPNELYDGRSANIRFYDPNSTVSEIVTINQAQKDAIIISKKEYAVDSNQNYISIEVNANVEFEAIVDEACSQWIQLADNLLTRALNPHKLDYIVAENNTYEKREGAVIIKSKNSSLADTVYISQSQNDAIFIESPQNVNISYEGGTVDVEINSNVEVEFEFLQDWTHNILKSRGLMKSTHSFEVDENDTPYERMGTVIIKKINVNAPADTMYIHQEKGFLTLVVTPGQLSSQLQQYNDLSIEMLKLYGSLNVQDYLALRDIKTLWNLDLSNLEDKTMPRQAFMNVDNIKTIKLPSSLEEIPDELFNMTKGGVMQGLTCELTIPSSVKRIGKYAFSCNALSGRLIIPGNVREIDEYAFWSLWGLSELIISDGVLRLNNSCFAGLSGNISKLYIGKSIEYMGDNVFNSCYYSGTIEIPDKVPSIGSTFFNGSKYSTIVLGASLTEIGWYSLNNIPDLKAMYCKSQVPPSYSFPVEGTPLLYLGVPRGSKKAYEQTEPWKNFMVIEEIDYDNFVIPGTN